MHIFLIIIVYTLPLHKFNWTLKSFKQSNYYVQSYKDSVQIDEKIYVKWAMKIMKLPGISHMHGTFIYTFFLGAFVFRLVCYSSTKQKKLQDDWWLGANYGHNMDFWFQMSFLVENRQHVDILYSNQMFSHNIKLAHDTFENTSTTQNLVT